MDKKDVATTSLHFNHFLKVLLSQNDSLLQLQYYVLNCATYWLQYYITIAFQHLTNYIDWKIQKLAILKKYLKDGKSAHKLDR